MLKQNKWYRFLWNIQGVSSGVALVASLYAGYLLFSFFSGPGNYIHPLKVFILSDIVDYIAALMICIGSFYRAPFSLILNLLNVYGMMKSYLFTVHQYIKTHFDASWHFTSSTNSMGLLDIVNCITLYAGLITILVGITISMMIIIESRRKRHNGKHISA